MTKYGIIGSEGRMGEALIAELNATGATLAGAIDMGGDPFALAADSDVLIDFSSPKALRSNLMAARTAGKPMVIGTTGLLDEHHREIDEVAHTIAVLQTGNTSLGVTLLAALVKQAAAQLGPDWDIEILEMHHRHKVDAPSGTAKLLGEAAAAGRGIALAENAVADRNQKRAEGHIGFASLRGGSVFGDHNVIFAGENERIELGHRAESRAVFARGAIKAAAWLVGKPAGRYRMSDVLDLGA
jgi:4-hydroxy-tetrahydrodipicolinate reductase